MKKYFEKMSMRKFSFFENVEQWEKCHGNIMKKYKFWGFRTSKSAQSCRIALIFCRLAWDMSRIDCESFKSWNQFFLIQFEILRVSKSPSLSVTVVTDHTWKLEIPIENEPLRPRKHHERIGAPSDSPSLLRTHEYHRLRESQLYPTSFEWHYSVFSLGFQLQCKEISLL